MVCEHFPNMCFHINTSSVRCFHHGLVKKNLYSSIKAVRGRLVILIYDTFLLNRYTLDCKALQEFSARSGGRDRKKERKTKKKDAKKKNQKKTKEIESFFF